MFLHKNVRKKHRRGLLPRLRELPVTEENSPDTPLRNYGTIYKNAGPVWGLIPE
jgi:hypothetical protein